MWRMATAGSPPKRSTVRTLRTMSRIEPADAAHSSRVLERSSEVQAVTAEEIGETPSPEAAAESAPEAAAEPEKPAASPAKPSGRRSREAPIPLEAALPAVIYEEFTAAVARAEEARDEIPSHPDDVETPEERGEAQAAPTREGDDEPAAEDGNRPNRPPPHRRHPATTASMSTSTGSATSGRTAKAAA